jgi:hypothetical protein
LHRRFSWLRFCPRAVVFIFRAPGLRSGTPFFHCFTRTGFMPFCRSASRSCCLDSGPIPRSQRRLRPGLILLFRFSSWQIDRGSGLFQSACWSSVSGIAAWFSLCSTRVPSLRRTTTVTPARESFPPILVTTSAELDSPG